MREVYLVDCRRTPIGVSGGSLRYTPPEKLAAAVMTKLWNDANRHATRRALQRTA